MLVLAGKTADLLDFRRCDIPRVKTTDATPLSMHCKHHLGSLFTSHSEKFLQYDHDEFHWREVIVQQQNLEHRRRLCLGLLTLENC